MNRVSIQQKLLFKLVQRSRNLCKDYNTKDTLQNQIEKYQLLNLLGQLDVSQMRLDRNISNITKEVGICNILDEFPLRITVYYLPQGEVMKLHDHPRMEIINYLLKGKMKANLYTPLSQGLYRKSTAILEKGSIRTIDGLRANQQNLHEFVALEPTFFLDIIFPDYDQQRACKFFQEQQQINESTYRLREIFDYEVKFRYLL